MYSFAAVWNLSAASPRSSACFTATVALLRHSAETSAIAPPTRTGSRMAHRLGEPPESAGLSGGAGAMAAHAFTNAAALALFSRQASSVPSCTLPCGLSALTATTRSALRWGEWQ